MSERNLEEVAARDLEAAGFVVARDARPPGRMFGASVHADVCGWSAGESAELEPEVVVEVKRGMKGAEFTLILAQLSRVAAAFGARRAFLFDGGWHEANDEFTRFHPSSCPRPRRQIGAARVPRGLLQAEVGKLLERERTKGPARHGEALFEFVLNEVASGSARALARLCETKSAKLSLARLLCERAEEWSAPEPLTSAMVRLLDPRAGDVVLDPVCGLGNALWATLESRPEVSVEGWWPSQTAVSAAKAFTAFSDVKARFTCTSFGETLAQRAQADRVIALPPFGVKLPARVSLESGPRDTADLDLAFLDRVPRWLRDGGRAVVVIPLRMLVSESAAVVRERLAREFRVVAVIELPGGLFDATKISVAILVLEKRASTPSVVARLGPDWVEQLGPKGQFFHVYEQHLSGDGP